MSIDINNINTGRTDGPNRHDNAKATQEVGSTHEKAVPASNETNPSDNVSLSNAAKDLAQIEVDLKALPEVNQNKVDAVKARIENGDYQIDAQNMAQKMLDMEK